MRFIRLRGLYEAREAKFFLLIILFLVYTFSRANLLIKPRAMERLLLAGHDDGIQFASPKDLCFEPLKHFSQAAPASHRRKLNHVQEPLGQRHNTCISYTGAFTTFLG
jgi:hypothetical protein